MLVFGSGSWRPGCADRIAALGRLVSGELRGGNMARGGVFLGMDLVRLEVVCEAMGSVEGADMPCWQWQPEVVGVQ